ncbi:MAG: hypothetical protein WBX25_11425 [Rhodomicrobium sp.]
MSLQALAAKIRAERLATAATAAPATVPPSFQPSVAEVATVAVAKPQPSKIVIASPQAMPGPSGGGAGQPNADGERLEQATFTFQSSPFAEQANALGWDEIALFGVHKGTHPKERIDVWGLIPLLAWSGLSLALTKMEADAATITSPRGSLLRHPRRRANHEEGIAWQAHPALREGGAA